VRSAILCSIMKKLYPQELYAFLVAQPQDMADFSVSSSPVCMAAIGLISGFG